MNWLDLNLASLGRLANSGLDGLFTISPRGRTRWIAYAWYLGLFSLGAALWGYLLNWGQISFGLHDWAELTGHRLAFLQNAVRSGQLPLHMPDGSALGNVTDRFLAFPDTIFSPQLVLLRFLALGPFVLVNTLLLYAAGFAGLVLLGRRLRLSAFAVSVIFFLFNFNGHITDHLVVGHMEWVGYFLLPLFILLVLEALDGQVGWRWTLQLSLVLLFIFLQGGFHLFETCLTFLGLLAISSRRMLRPIGVGIGFSLLVSMGRILPPALEFRNIDSKFLSGFETVGQLVQALVQMRIPVPEQVFSRSPLSPLGWWEIDHYIGVLGLAFLLGYGLLYASRNKSAGLQLSRLGVPLVGMTILSIGRIYKLISLAGIPLISSQRVSSRFFILPLLFLLVLAAANLQSHLNRLRRSGATPALALALALFGVGVNDLWQHAKLWRFERMFELFANLQVDLTGEFIANHPDPAYALALGIGWAVAALTLIALVYLAARESRAPAGKAV
jgi:hypothetical protein